MKFRKNEFAEMERPGEDAVVGAKIPKFWALRRAIREFELDECADLAAGLTYRAVLSIFPAALALMSLLGVLAQADKVIAFIRDSLTDLLSPEVVENIVSGLTQFQLSTASPWIFGAAVAVAIWSASGYVSGLARALNRINEVPEGRALWKLLPQQLIITLVSILVVAVTLLLLVVSGPVLAWVTEQLGVGDLRYLIEIAKWPVLLLLVFFVIGLFYWGLPNVKQRFRLFSAGAVLAVLLWALATAGFAFYVFNFSNYNATYGALGGVVIALIWLWLTNVALLFGAELNSERARLQQLRSGVAAEAKIQFPVRDAKASTKAATSNEKILSQDRKIREAHTPTSGDTKDMPFLG